MIISFLGVIWRKSEYETGLDFLSILSDTPCVRLETVCGPTLVLRTVRNNSRLLALIVFQCLEIRAVLPLSLAFGRMEGRNCPISVSRLGTIPEWQRCFIPACKCAWLPSRRRETSLEPGVLSPLRHWLSQEASMTDPLRILKLCSQPPGSLGLQRCEV